MKLEPKEKEKVLEAFGKRLDKLIYKSFRSKDLFFRETGFHKANIYDILSGEGDPRFSTLYRLAKSLGVSMEELVRVEKPVRSEKPKGKSK